MEQIKSKESAYDKLCARLQTEPHTWLVTGVAGFIGSNLLETLLKLDQRVVGLDNFATGHQRNLDEVQTLVTSGQWANFHFIDGDIRKLEDCRRAMIFPRTNDASEEGAACVEYVLHEAALGSVPRSLTDPIATNEVNVSGFLNMLVAARDAGVDSFTYAASSSTYGDHPDLPKIEENIGKQLSPYAVTKYVNELYASIFSLNYEIKTIGLRYFNVFGQRQDPEGQYSAVIPLWIKSIIRKLPLVINGDGETTRDFCYIKNVIQANLLAATKLKKFNENKNDSIYNVAAGVRISLNELYVELVNQLSEKISHKDIYPTYENFRKGDILHSLASIVKIKSELGYIPVYSVKQGLAESIPWYIRKLS